MAFASYLVAAVLGYLVGSLPTAYIAVKWKTHRDIRTLGSGNVGTLNSYEVTNSKLVGATVLAIDLLKGIGAVALAGMMGGEFTPQAIAALAAVLGHNFPVWLRFRGGRGLATAAGTMLVLGWVIVPVWMLAWFVGYRMSRDVNVGNAVATLLMPALPFVVPAEVLERWIPAAATAIEPFRIFILGLALLILVRLVEPVKQYLTRRAARA